MDASRGPKTQGKKTKIAGGSKRISDSESDYESEDDGSDSLSDCDEASVLKDLATWESEPEDDENNEAPDYEDHDDPSLDNALGTMQWVDVQMMRTDPRSEVGADPESFAPVFRLANYEQETLL